jgi:hypothetical protein
MRSNFIVHAGARFGLLVALLMTPPVFAADDPGPAPSTPASRAEQACREARGRYQSQPTNAAAAWQFASACFDQCEFSRNDADRAGVANQGINACRQALARDPGLAAAHYYLGMDLAQLARTERLGALGLLKEVEEEWRTAIKLDENFDYAGPDRNLGQLYLNAPGWPWSIGSRPNARQHLLRAVRLHPEYPENHLNLIEAYLKWNDHAQGRLAANELTQLLPDARKKFTGPAWESNWEDWNKRWQAIQTKLSQKSDLSPSHHKK